MERQFGILAVQLGFEPLQLLVQYALPLYIIRYSSTYKVLPSLISTNSNTIFIVSSSIGVDIGESVIK
jgi:hypothetical protein